MTENEWPQREHAQGPRVRASFPRPVRAGAIAALLVALSACGGSGGGGDGGEDPPPASPVTVSGTITFDRVPFSQTVGAGLDFDATIEDAPARGIIVEVVDAGNQTVLGDAITDAQGRYSIAGITANRSVFVRARARMLEEGPAPAWDFEVRDNTSGDALYVLDGATFNTGTADVTRNLHADSGWGGSSYTNVRAAAPFAILDTLFEAQELLVAAAGDIDLGALDLFWSEDNRASAEFCPDTGAILTSIFLFGGTDDCVPPSTSPTGIYLLGDFDLGDTDEFDQHVIAHELGHYLEDVLSRSDSIGGDHALADRLDLRVAFAEGWGNAFAAMVLDDPLYRDSFQDAQGSFDGNFDVESEPLVPARGWFSEVSVQEILWDVFDDDVDIAGVSQGETLALGFGPILDVLTSDHAATAALTSIYPFAATLRAQNQAAAVAIDALLADNGITGMGDFGTGETNWPLSPNAMPVIESDVLPVYTPIVLNQAQVQVCGVRAFGTYNKLANRRFLTFSIAQTRLVSITVTGLSGTQVTPRPDPDFIIWRNGQIVEIAESVDPGDPPQEQLDITLNPGDYVLEVYEFSHVDVSAAAQRRERTCMNVSVTG